MTIRELVKIAVEGLKKDFYTENEQIRLVDYILESSSLGITPKDFSIKSFNMFGVGQENKDRELPSIPSFLVFFWGNINYSIEENEGIIRHWYLKSVDSFETLEYEISTGLVEDGEYVVLVEGEVQPFRKEKVCKGFNEISVIWEKLQPYYLFYYTDDDSINREELFNSKKKVEERVLELLKTSNINNYRITNIIDDIDYGFTIQADIFSVDNRGNTSYREPIFIWDNTVDLGF